MVLRLFIRRITSIPLVMFLGVKTILVKFIPSSGDRSDTCVSWQSQVRQRHPFQRRQVGYLLYREVQVRQRHPFQRRQVGYLCPPAMQFRQRHPIMFMARRPILS